jgi:hypothetical protein
MVAVHQQELNMDLHRYALDDENLAKVWGTRGDNQIEDKQNTYAYIIMSRWNMRFRLGYINKNELEATISHYMGRSEYLQRYSKLSLDLWKMTGMEDPLHREFCEVCEAVYQSLMTKDREEEAPIPN